MDYEVKKTIKQGLKYKSRFHKAKTKYMGHIE